MSLKVIAKSTQEQAVASWIDYLNQLRVDSLCDFLNNQSDNYIDAMNYIDTALENIRRLIESNRGGETGIHGFIAEIAESGVENAKNVISGKKITTEWVNDNGIDDIRRITNVQSGQVVESIQQKFYNSDLSLNAILKHYEKYPDFIKNGGKYQIPKDQYQKIIQYLNISKSDAIKMQTSDGSFSYKQWKFVHDFFESNKIKINKIEPADFNYHEVQKGKIFDSMDTRRKEIENIDRKLRQDAYENSLPTFKEGIKIMLVSAAAEGTTTFLIELISLSKKKGGLIHLNTSDWEYVFSKSTYGTAKGGTRGAVVYVLSNFTSTPAAVATAMVTASFGIAEQVYQFRKGELSEVEMLEKTEWLCLDATMSAISALLGQFLIPVPILGALIGNTVGMIMYSTVKQKCFINEKKIFDNYLYSINQMEKELTEQYLFYVKKMKTELLSFIKICSQAFSVDPASALVGSINLAYSVGVNDEKVLKNNNDIYNYFMK